MLDDILKKHPDTDKLTDKEKSEYNQVRLAKADLLLRLGDLPGTLMTLMALPGDYELTVRRRTPVGDFAVARHALQETLGDLTEALNLALARQYLAALEQDAV